MAEKTVTVPNIACDHCVATIERTLDALDGVSSVNVDRAAKRVHVEWTDGELTWDGIAASLEQAGYPAE